MAHVLGNDVLESCYRSFEPPQEAYGESLQRDPDYHAVRSEIQTLTASSGGEGELDWKSIEERCVQLLATRSKDMVVAGYLALALFRRHGYRGLADGVVVLDELLKHWPGIFPPVARPRPRVMALEWLVERLTPFVKDRVPEEDEVRVMASIRDRLRSVQEQANEHLKHEAPGLGTLISAVSALVVEEAPEAEPARGAREKAGEAAEAAEKAPTGSAASGTPAPSPAPAPRSATTAAAPAVDLPPAEPLPSDASARQIKDRLRQLVAPLRQAGLLSPLPYRLLRGLKWDDVTGSPPLDPKAEPGSGRTRVPAPRAQQRAALEALLQTGRWQELLEASEGAFQEGSGTFWLDLQRYAVLALEHLDPVQGRRSASLLKEQLAELLTRCPGLAQLSFADGSRLADDATRQWLETAVRKDDTPMSLGGGDGDAAAIPAEDVEKVQQLFADGQAEEAMVLLQQAIDGAANARIRFRARLIAGQLCLRSFQLSWARFLLEGLQQEMESLRFEDWQPELAVEVYQGLALCHARTLRAGDLPEEARAELAAALEPLKKRLLRLDLRAVVAVEAALKQPGAS